MLTLESETDREDFMNSSPELQLWTPRQGPFNAQDYIHDLLPNGSRFEDEVWDYRPIAHPSDGTKKLSFRRVPKGYQETVRSFLALRGRPSHEGVVERGVVLRGRPAPVGALVGVFTQLRTLAEWGDARGLDSFRQWTQSDADGFVKDAQEGKHRPGGITVKSATLSGYTTMIKRLEAYSPALPDGLQFVPWPMRTASRVAGYVQTVENVTSPLPWATWAPLIAGSWKIVESYSEVILRAHEALRDAPINATLGRGFIGQPAVSVLSDYFEHGGHVPLHTGFGKSGGNERGTPNFSMLARLTGLSTNAFKRSHHGNAPQITRLIDDALLSGASRFGGLILPEERESDGWIDEIGIGEAEFLPSVLRGACYVVISGLSGMRDSEIQALEVNCLAQRDGLPVLRSVQIKGNQTSGGVRRDWWIPRAVERTIQVLERLATHSLLFARGGRDGTRGGEGAYSPSKDIGRLIAFVNSPPGDRPGRGRALGLDPMVLDSEAINATSLRRSFSVFAATKPGAELGLGIQLGHMALRQTSGYMADSKSAAVSMLSDDRAAVVKDEVRRLITSKGEITGEGGAQIRAIRAKVLEDPTRAEALAMSAAEDYHLGIVNDCWYRRHAAACGEEGPQLASHFCAASRCANAVVHDRHAPAIKNQIVRVDLHLEKPKIHPAFEAAHRQERAELVNLLAIVDKKDPR
jgi:hypothetical protein